nr:MAG TPA: hypothetical protein [Caudoviricetes sp.]
MFVLIMFSFMKSIQKQQQQAGNMFTVALLLLAK